jgi:cation diffusion facilitator CzcD-associated flavoprotein CzcO
MTERVDVAIIGGGSAGLATSWYLTQAGVGHVVLEAGRVAETWRTRRWDSFCLVTPNWSVNLPGAKYDGPDPDGFMPLAQLIDYLQAWSDSFHAPVREQTGVHSLERQGDDFVLSLLDEQLRARAVVVATGAFQRPYRPAGSEALPSGLLQIYSEEYRNPGALPPGAVLIVGSGQTGCQLAEELHDAGRRVFVACGRCSWAPRRLGDHDLVWWADKTGFLDRTPDMLPSPAARLLGNIQATGHRGGHDLHYRVLDAMGVELLGRFLGAEDNKIRFADDLADSVDFGDGLTMMFMKMVRNYCEANSVPLPAFEPPPPMRIKTRTELDVAGDEIGSVIWTSGYRPDYGWVKLAVFDDMGFPVQTDGRSSVPGLYFMGVHWLRKAKSSVLWGVGEDAEIVAGQIVADRR